MTNHPPKPERDEYRVRSDSKLMWAVFRGSEVVYRNANQSYAKRHCEDLNAGHNACLAAAEAHYESRLAEHRQALKELVETLEATRFIGGGRTGKTHLAAALEAARSLLEGESNE